jgi:hypothetical protein
MLKIDTAGSSQRALHDAVALGLASGARGPQASVHSQTELLVRRLRYYAGLLQAGYRHALRPDPLPRSLRAERIALGIDLPELDTVPLWSARRDDGALAVPFIEFILAQIAETLETLARSAEDDPRAGEAFDAARREVLAAQEQIDPASGPRPALPRLRDLYLQEGFMQDLCGPGGILERQRELCEALLLAHSPAAGH